MSDHRAARNRLAMEANHFGLDTDTAARLAARAESMGLLSDRMSEIDALEALAAERLEYGVTAVIGGRRLIMSSTRHGNTMDGMGRWFPMKELAEDFMRTVTAPEPQLVCRRASTYWEATNE